MIKNIVNRGDSTSNLRRYLSTSNKSASSFNLNVALIKLLFSSCISLSNQKTDLVFIGLSLSMTSYSLILRVSAYFSCTSIVICKNEIGRMNIGDTISFLRAIQLVLLTILVV